MTITLEANIYRLFNRDERLPSGQPRCILNVFASWLSVNSTEHHTTPTTLHGYPTDLHCTTLYSLSTNYHHISSYITIFVSFCKCIDRVRSWLRQETSLYLSILVLSIRLIDRIAVFYGHESHNRGSYLLLQYYQLLKLNSWLKSKFHVHVFFSIRNKDVYSMKYKCMIHNLVSALNSLLFEYLQYRSYGALIACTHMIEINRHTSTYTVSTALCSYTCTVRDTLDCVRASCDFQSTSSKSLLS